jgi:hypothetical protein
MQASKNLACGTRTSDVTILTFKCRFKLGKDCKGFGRSVKCRMSISMVWYSTRSMNFSISSHKSNQIHYQETVELIWNQSDIRIVVERDIKCRSPSFLTMLLSRCTNAPYRRWIHFLDVEIGPFIITFVCLISKQFRKQTVEVCIHVDCSTHTPTPRGRGTGVWC